MKKSDWIALIVLGVGFLLIITALSCFVNGEPEFGIKAGIIGGVAIAVWGIIKYMSKK